MGARHVAHAAGWAAGCVAGPLALRVALGRGWLLIGVLTAIAATVWLLLWLPRAAHRAFEAGRYRKAGRRYHVISAFAFSARRERAGLLSRAGSAIAAGDADRAGPLLDALAPDALDAAERAVWLNNRACLLLERDGAAAALALAEEAVGLRPDVPAIQHTRARALLALERVDEAIGVLEAMRTGGELAATLEADRCRELALAWERKGQPDYASDYRERATAVARA